MAKFHWALVIGGLVSLGCHIQHNEGGDGSIFDDQESCANSKQNETASDAGSDAPVSCTVHAECPTASYCDAELGHCVANAEAPTCDEIQTEAECRARPECESIYAGVGCSCGPDCECKGGEPGCVCESFEFFRCAAPAG